LRWVTVRFRGGDVVGGRLTGVGWRLSVWSVNDYKNDYRSWP
jgi:hypothetical protein